ncbi:hypothetical protein BJL95_19790 [Methylomonas sp. LWB]|nr:hypothetical protein BJL95_19790 [Methylomonas sp. LWB]
MSWQSLAEELDAINRHITVNADDFEEAASDYNHIAERLVEKLHWPNDAIRIIPQGSSSTKTLIRMPGPGKFDIDAVCAVDISKIEAKDPIVFFEKIGEALEDWLPSAKKRCWCVEFTNRRYYIEFTPSVPLNTIPAQAVASICYRPSDRYSDTALAVVDTPTRRWKTSNPEGFSNWVSDQAKRIILVSLLLEKRAMEALASDSVAPVPEQQVPLSDTLRIAIRLLKRHRDMSVQRGYFEAELKPISVIIVTLLTQCYEGLADQNARYSHPIELLADLAQLMPGMIEIRNGDYWIENPTVAEENFAEKWNTNHTLKDVFDNWCELLIDDLQSILSSTDERSLCENIRSVFGCTAVTGSVPPSSSGLASRAPNRVHNVPARGLA